MKSLFQGIFLIACIFVTNPLHAQFTPCENGIAEFYECREIDLLGHLTVAALDADFDQHVTTSSRLNDVWGWTDPLTEKEYALVGRSDGVSVVDISNPERPVYVANLPKANGSQSSVWRDIKVYENHAFVVADNSSPHFNSEGNHLQVFDLRQVRDIQNPPVHLDEAAIYDHFPSAHNLFINTATGFAYVVGVGGPQRIPDGYLNAGECGSGLHIVDISEPTEPAFAGCFAQEGTGRAGTGYTHDVQCVIYHGPDADYAGREVCVGSNETHVVIVDVTAKEMPTIISTATYPGATYVHQGWLTENHRYFLQDDELDERRGFKQNTTTFIWDLKDLDNPELISTFAWPTKAIDHNLYVVENMVFASNYESGLRVLDITNIENPEEIAFFDTFPQSNNTNFNGTWSNYPFFDSEVVAVSDITNGLYLLKLTVSGRVVPETFAVAVPAPNPFREQSRISLRADADRHVRVIVYDALGRQVAVLFNGSMTTGEQRILSFNPAPSLAGGVYWVRVQEDDFVETRAVVYVK